MLLVQQQEGHPLCKTPATAIPNIHFYGCGLIWSESGKTDCFNRNWKYTTCLVAYHADVCAAF